MAADTRPTQGCIDWFSLWLLGIQYQKGILMRILLKMEMEEVKATSFMVYISLLPMAPFTNMV